MSAPFFSSSSRSDLRELLRYSEEVLGAYVELDSTRTKRTLLTFKSTQDKIRQAGLRYGEPFRLTVVGEFKAGKSMMVNAMLGMPNLLREGVVPTTGAVTELWWGDKENGRVLDADGKEVFSGTLAEAALYADQRTPQGKQMSGKGARVVLHVPLDVLRNLVIIDTPGLGASEADDRVTLESLNMADAAILVLNAHRTTGERAVDLAERLRLADRRMLTVVTRADQVDAATLKSATDTAIQEFGAVTDGEILTFGSAKVIEAQQSLRIALDASDQDGVEKAKQLLSQYGYSALRSRLAEDYFSGGGQAARKRADHVLTDLRILLGDLQHGATEEHIRANTLSEALAKSLSEIERIVKETLEPKKPALDAQLEEIVARHIGDLLSDLAEAADIFIERIADGGISLGLDFIRSKISNSYEKKLKNKLHNDFQELFPEEQLDITVSSIDRGVRRLLELEWKQTSAEIDARFAGKGVKFDTASITTQLGDHLAQVSVAIAIDLGAAIALLFIPGGALVDAVVLITSLFGTANIAGKGSARIARVKREARHTVQMQRRKLVHQISAHFRHINEETCDLAINQTRQGAADQERVRSEQHDLSEKWRRAHRDVGELLETVLQQAEGGGV